MYLCFEFCDPTSNLKAIESNCKYSMIVNYDNNYDKYFYNDGIRKIDAHVVLRYAGEIKIYGSVGKTHSS